MVIARVCKCEQEVKYQTLYSHSKGVANLCGKFCAKFGFENTGKLIGLCHDLGKASEEYQKYVISDRLTHVDHSTFGGKFIYQKLMEKKFDSFSAVFIAQIIMGHHSGLPNHQDGTSSSFVERLKKDIPNIDLNDIEQIILEIDLLIEFSRKEFADYIIDFKGCKQDKIYFSIQMLARMLFSCLCDADSLDSETFCNNKKNNLRGSYENSSILLKNISTAIYNKQIKAKTSNLKINKTRDYVLDCCRKASLIQTMDFTLAADVAYGKTLSSLELGWQNCVNFKKNGVIYIAPVNRILGQTSDICREIFGKNNVLEHHSNVIAVEEKTELSAENWDMPMITTSFERLFDGLFACKRAQCRRLHNICNKVVIVDEYQNLPIERKNQTDFLMEELKRMYSVVFIKMSATPPPSDCETYNIIPNPEELRKENIRYFYKDLGEITVEELVETMHDFSVNKNASCLAILQYTSHVREAFSLYCQKYGGDNVFCLYGTSTMTPKDQIATLAKVEKALKMGVRPVLFSTQVIEAGVDISFFSLFKEGSGIDGLKQSFGRCNRHGECDMGYAFRFRLKGKKDPLFHENCEAAREIHANAEDIFKMKNVDYYFEKLMSIKACGISKYKFDKGSLISNKICARQGFNFREIAEFSLIDSSTTSIMIPCKETDEILNDARRIGKLTMRHNRQLQQYCVNVFCATPKDPLPKKLEKMAENKLIALNEFGFWYLTNKKIYSNVSGLNTEGYIE